MSIRISQGIGAVTTRKNGACRGIETNSFRHQCGKLVKYNYISQTNSLRESSYVHNMIIIVFRLQMETVMKQAEEAKRNAQDSARRLLEEYRPLKHDVDLMRTELLGLEKLPDLPQSDKERMGSIG